MPNNESHQNDNCNKIDLEIASQKLRIPATYQTALITFIIVAGLVIIEHLNGTVSKAITTFANTAGLHNPDGTVTKNINATIYEFWTPGVNTIYDIENPTRPEEESRQPKKQIYNEKKQHKKCEETVKYKKYCTTYMILKKFGNELKKHGAQGYTRYHGWGEGKSGLKRGWTWRVTVPKSDGFTKKTLLVLYSNYFHRTENIYIEEIQVGKTLTNPNKK